MLDWADQHDLPGIKFRLPQLSAAAFLCRLFNEEIKRASMSETNKAFERYMGKDTDDDLRSVYEQSAEVISIDKSDKEMTKGKTI
ncbi:MAG: hypothetical protein ABSB79_08245 [Syntrophales bacterium]|jgi:hypothetical protein